MTAEMFRAWLDRMGMGTNDAAAILGMGRNTITRYKKDGAPDHIAYACAAIAQGLPKWGG